MPMNFKELQERVNRVAVENHGHPNTWKDNQLSVYLEAVRVVLEAVSAVELPSILVAVVEESLKQGCDTMNMLTTSVFEDGEFPSAMLYEAVRNGGALSIKDLLAGAIYALSVHRFDLPTKVELPCCVYCRADNLTMLRVAPKNHHDDPTYTTECATCGARGPEMPSTQAAWGKVVGMHNRLDKAPK